MKFDVETITPELMDKATVEANSRDQASFIAGAMFGAAAVVHMQELYVMGQLLGIAAVQDHLEHTLSQVDVYTNRSVIY